MMKKVGVLFLATLFVFSASFASEVANKDLLVSALDAWEAGQQLTPAQKEMARDYIKDIVNNRQIDNAGGPDAYGYTYKDSEEVDGPVFSWIDPTGGMLIMDIAGVGDDAYVGPFNLNYAFNFYGTDYSQFWIHSNGGISFNDPGSSLTLSNSTLPYTSWPFDGFFWFWDDMDPQEATVTLTSVAGGQLLTFLNWYEYPDGNAEGLDFQVLLGDDGSMLFQYDNINPLLDITSETIGIQSAYGDLGFLEASYGFTPDLYPYNGLAILFEAGAPPASGTVSGTVTDADSGNPIEGATVNIGGTDYFTDANGMYTSGTMFTGMYDWTASALGYDGDSGMVDVMEGANTLDVALSPIDYTGDVLIMSLDETVDSAPAITAIIEGMGYSTVTVTNFWEVPLGNYEYVFLFCGIYPNDFHVSANTDEETELINYYNGGGNLYVEGGDFFAYTPPTNLMDVLPVNGDADGGSDLLNVNGVAGTFTDGFDMAYAGENSWIDHLSVDGDATLVLTNPADGAGCGVVSADFAGFSFEVGMLTDGAGSRGDIIAGVFDGFNPVAAPLTVTLAPTGDPFVPATGGTLNFDVGIVSTLPNLYTGVWFFTTVELPNGNMYPQNLFQIQFNLPPNASLGGNLNQDIPAFAPAGFYTMYGTVAGNPQGIGPNFSGSFDFEKGALAAGGNPVNGWDVSGGLNIAGDADLVTLPAEFELAKVYPNPFNPTANVSVSLPTAADLTVAVYNVMGQQVAELASGQVQAGTHNFVLDGSNLSSGIYFVQATVPGELNAVQKVTLMK